MVSPFSFVGLILLFFSLLSVEVMGGGVLFFCFFVFEISILPRMPRTLIKRSAKEFTRDESFPRPACSPDCFHEVDSFMNLCNS